MNDSKLQVLEAAIARQQSVIDDMKRRVRDLLANDGNVNEEEYDNSVQSLKSQSTEEAGGLNEQIAFAAAELETLNRLRKADSPADTVVPGAIVVTDHNTFFVSVSIEEFKAGNSTYFGVSTESPVYKAMKGKKAGDVFSVAGRSYTIKRIY